MISIIDIETDSANPDKANLKYFGGLDYETGEVFMCDFTKEKDIKNYIEKSKILIGFNLKGFDLKVLEKFGVDLKYKVIIDLYEILAPKGDNGFGSFNKDRLKDINPALKFPNYKLKTIIEVLKLDEFGKGYIDYNILKKDKWEEKEDNEIKKYLKQDLVIEKKLFDWLRNIFIPLEKYLKTEDVIKFKHLKCSSGVLAYKFICEQTGLKEEYNDRDEVLRIKRQSEKIEGGYHIHPEHEKVRGNIVCMDFVSHYPTIIIMGNLHNPAVVAAIHKNLKERLDAKKKNDKITALALKVPLNSMYGIMGNPTFKNIYNPEAASKCTQIGRELLKQYAKTLEISGFEVLYGFTDSVYCGIPRPLDNNDLEIVTKCFIEKTKKKFPNPIESYNLGVDGSFKFIWFIDKKYNNYLSVDNDNNIKMKGGTFNKNCPRCVLKVFEDYIKPKIIRELDVNFTEKELHQELHKVLKTSPELASQNYSVKLKEDYKLDTCLNYKISDRYGNGQHQLIPNDCGIGVIGCSDISYCTTEEFYKNNLLTENISIERMMRYFLPFHTTKEEVFDI